MRNLKILRNEKGLSQLDLAEELNIPQSTYAQYESGSTEPKFSTLITLADYFNVTVDFLIDRTAIREPAQPIDTEISYRLTYIKNKKAKDMMLGLLREIRQDDD